MRVYAALARPPCWLTAVGVYVHCTLAKQPSKVPVLNEIYVSSPPMLPAVANPLPSGVLLVVVRRCCLNRPGWQQEELVFTDPEPSFVKRLKTRARGAGDTSALEKYHPDIQSVFRPFDGNEHQRQIKRVRHVAAVIMEVPFHCIFTAFPWRFAAFPLPFPWRFGCLSTAFPRRFGCLSLTLRCLSFAFRRQRTHALG